MPFPPRLKSPKDIFPPDGHRPQDEEQAVVPGDPVYGECNDRDSEESSSRLF
jgi:hypothetical protein